jgi:hypothetical protein
MRARVTRTNGTIRAPATLALCRVSSVVHYASVGLRAKGFGCGRVPVDVE